MLKQLILNWDVRIGALLPLRHIAYTEETILTQGHGSYTREEWTKARRAGYNQVGLEAHELDSEAGFLSRALGTERRKLLTGLRLADHLRESGCRSILEVGCGEMVTAWAIKGCLPSIRYCATDYDDYVIMKCQKLALLDPLEKSTLDIDAVRADFLEEFQLVLAWDVFYSFDTARLESFLEKIKAAGSSLIICSSQIIGPLRGFSYLVKSLLKDYVGQCRTGRLRDHGYKSSLGYYHRVARALDMDCRLIATPPAGERNGDSYCFIRISSRPRRPSNIPLAQ